MKSLMKFNFVNAASVDEAVSILKNNADRASLLAGGTDLLGTMRFEILPDYPETVINLKTIPGLDYIREEDGMVKIGALTRLSPTILSLRRIIMRWLKLHVKRLRPMLGRWVPLQETSVSSTDAGTSGKRTTGLIV
jgi:xanthine dehydrogenase iron-sulfur cluster and FAD-binding subunit A